MTFEEAREKHLQKLDAAYAALRTIIADPQWCNPMFPKFKEALESLHTQTTICMNLNAAECEAGG